MKKSSLITVMVLVSLAVVAQEAPAPVPADLPVTDFLAQVMDAIKGFGGLAWTMKVASILMLIISTMKVSFIRAYTWDKLHGSLKVLVAPLLAMLAGFFSMGHFDKASLLAWAFAGAGAILLKNLLDAVKLIPGIGPQYVSFINLIESILMKPKA